MLRLFLVERDFVGIGITLFKKVIVPRGLTVVDEIVGEGLPHVKGNLFASQIFARQDRLWGERHLAAVGVEFN